MSQSEMYFSYHVVELPFSNRAHKKWLIKTKKGTCPPLTLGNMCIAIFYFPGCDVTNFEIKPFITWPKFQDKKLNVLMTKRASNMK